MTCAIVILQHCNRTVMTDSPHDDPQSLSVLSQTKCLAFPLLSYQFSAPTVTLGGDGFSDGTDNVVLRVQIRNSYWRQSRAGEALLSPYRLTHRKQELTVPTAHGPHPVTPSANSWVSA